MNWTACRPSRIEFTLSVLSRVTGIGRTTRHHSRGTNERVVQTINASDRTWRVGELVHQMRADGWNADLKDEIEAVRAALSRAVAAGEVSRPSYGVYGPARHDAFLATTTHPRVQDHPP